VRTLGLQQLEPTVAVFRLVHAVTCELAHQAEELACVAIILDEQHPFWRRTIERRGDITGCYCLVNLRQPHGERAATPGPAARRDDGPAMQLDEAADERQADAEAALGTVQRALALHEHVEDGWQQLGRDAEPGVRDAEHRVAAVGAQ